MTCAAEPAVWFPTVRTGTGTDVFTTRLVDGLLARGIRAEIAWLPLRAEYAPWAVSSPPIPAWATVVHVNTWLHPRFIPRGLPLVATLHHSVHDPELRRYKGAARAAYHGVIAGRERRVMRRADSVVSVSEFVAQSARQMLADVPMEVIYNGVDTERFRPPQRRRTHALPFKLLYVGSWMTRKGVDLLAPIMRALGDGYELHYTGGTSVGMSRLEMPLNMHDVGRLDIDSIVGVMQQADALLFPSRSEGLPLVAIEAMASGLPVVAFRRSSLPEVIEDGLTGILAAPDDIGGIADAVRRLARDPIAWLQMSDRACIRAQQRFAIDTMIDAYANVYRRICEANDGSS